MNKIILIIKLFGILMFVYFEIIIGVSDNSKVVIVIKVNC